MKDLQEQLDKAQRTLRRCIEATDGLVAQAKAGADHLCAVGDLPASAQVRAMEASLRLAGAMLTEAYGKGRALQIQTGGGVIQPQGGGKD